MASLLKAQQRNAEKAKGKGKNKASEDDSSDEEVATAAVDVVAPKRNRQRVLMLSSRSITGRMRHLMKDIEVLLPHVKRESKLSSISLIPEIADLNNCNNCLYFESRFHEDLYLWASKTPNGPSIRMLVQNIHTMDELKMTGNCLKGSRGLLSFDAGFEKDEQWKLIKEIFTHIFGVPPGARRSKPFIDHILSFSIVDERIWFRNYQIVEKDPLQPEGRPTTSLVEIGPRFVLTPIKIFEGAFNGAVVYNNMGSHYVFKMQDDAADTDIPFSGFIPPQLFRASKSQDKIHRFQKRKLERLQRHERRVENAIEESEFAVSKIFA
ncbi:Ribosome biogenesis protein brx1 [Tulasnella sp. 403]|nr:Ribosome biogenesis protein brx1 [Tulasnella sp. 403]